MENLFSNYKSDNMPLSEMMRPATIDDMIGQNHLIGEEGILRRIIAQGNIPSMILWGPPGIGKTTLAQIIAKSVNKPFYTLSAISSGVKEVRQVIENAKYNHGAILFIDEIHRFNKAQQDSLLSAVEKGIIKLIGATTENPSFEVINPLLSRCQVYVLNSFTEDDFNVLIEKAIAFEHKQTGKNIIVKEKNNLIKFSGGDARKLLNVFELVVNNYMSDDEIVIDDDKVSFIVHQNMAKYDKLGEQHYDVISAFIKSVRGSDPNAAVYWLARMLEGGEDPKFIARRLLILASEDIGNANPNALILANSCFQAVNVIGVPESRIILSQTTIYLASSAKSNSSYMAINMAQEELMNSGNLSVPIDLRNAPTKLMKNLGYGKDYKYSHNYENNFKDQEFLPNEIEGKKFYEPGKNSREEELRNRLKNLWKDKYNY